MEAEPVSSALSPVGCCAKASLSRGRLPSTGDYWDLGTAKPDAVEPRRKMQEITALCPEVEEVKVLSCQHCPRSVVFVLSAWPLPPRPAADSSLQCIPVRGFLFPLPGGVLEAD